MAELAEEGYNYLYLYVGAPLPLAERAAERRRSAIEASS